MKSAILSTAYFPCSQYLTKFLVYDKILIEQDESFSKQSYRNRCYILSANKVQSLSIPVKKENSKNIKDILIDYSEDWQRNHIKAIMSAYKNSAFFDFFEDEVNKIINSKQKYLFDLNILSLDFLLNSMQINKEYFLNKNYYKADGSITDYRDSIHPKKRMQKNDPKFTASKYIQVFSDRYEFKENLSGLDLLFNEGAAASVNLTASINTNT